ncbi:type II secretion system F family protein [Oryzobacter terrae]|uniref:type II secretion system F family protein n=1 Tax=Oryzobacter terrae TaxID=1620385 RepID=UPI00366B6E29
MTRAAARSVLTRTVGVAVLATTALLTGAASASAEASATFSDLRSANGHVTGSLIIRGVDPKQIDTTQVIARVDGKSAVVKLAPATTSSRSTMLVIDTSGSMGEAGMGTVRTAVKDFLAAVPKDVKVGVVSFASTAGVDVKPTTDRAKVQSVVNGLRARGETALYEAVQDAVAALGTEGERSIVLLSDGEDTVAGADGNVSRDAQQRRAATTALTKAKVRAEVVAFKNDAGRAVLNGFANVGGGTVVSAADRNAVRVAFDTAAKTLEGQVRFDLTVPAGLTGEYEVVLDGSAAGQKFSTAQSINVTASAPEVDTSLDPVIDTAVNGSAPEARIASMSGVFLPIALVTVLVGLFVIVLAFFGPAFRSRRSARVSEIENYGLGAGAPGAHRTADGGNGMGEQLIQMGDRVMSGRESTTKTMQLIERADLPWRAGEWFVIRILAVFVGGIGFFALLGSRAPLLGVLVGVVLGIFLPSIALRWLANRRAKKFEAILPDVMMLVATSLSSGFSLLQALDSVARDAAEPAGKEFSRALAESRIGFDISDALEHVAVRMKSENMRWAVMAIRIQREVGGNLAETLRTTSATLRERESLKRHVRALSAEGRLSAYILIALPVGIFLFSMWSNYEYVSLLWTTFMGIVMSVSGIVAMILGIFWMKKTVSIEV